MSTDRAREVWTIYKRRDVAFDVIEGPCTGGKHDGGIRVVSLDAAVAALRERGEFACGGFEKEAAAFLEAEFGVPQPEQPA